MAIALQDISSDDKMALPDDGGATIFNWGVVRQEAPHGLRVIIPPLRSWRQLHWGYLVAVSYFGIAAIITLAAICLNRPFDPLLIVPTTESVIIPMAILWFALDRLHRRTFIDVTARELIVTFVWRHGRAHQRFWPRADITDVSASHINGKLIIHCRNRDVDEIFLGKNQALVNWLAEMLQNAIKTNYQISTETGFVSFDKVSSAARIASMIFYTAICLAIAGGILAFFAPPAAIIAVFFSILLITAAAGISYGTQEKFYL